MTKNLFSVGNKETPQFKIDGEGGVYIKKDNSDNLIKLQNGLITGITLDSSTNEFIITGINVGLSGISIPKANNDHFGGVKSSKTGTVENRDYNVEVNEDGTMKVNVPWVDATTTHFAISSSTSPIITPSVPNIIYVFTTLNTPTVPLRIKDAMDYWTDGKKVKIQFINKTSRFFNIIQNNDNSNGHISDDAIWEGFPITVMQNETACIEVTYINSKYGWSIKSMNTNNVTGTLHVTESIHVHDALSRDTYYQNTEPAMFIEPSNIKLSGDSIDKGIYFVNSTEDYIGNYRCSSINVYDNDEKYGHSMRIIPPLVDSNRYLYLEGRLVIGEPESDKNMYAISTNGDIKCNSIVGSVSSDISLKENIDNSINYIERINNLGDVVEYNYTKEAIETHDGLNDETHTGLIYQNVKDSKIYKLSSEDNDGHGFINYYSPDLIATMIGAIQQLSKELKETKEELSELKDKIEKGN